MGTRVSFNDHLIDRLIDDPRFEITADGKFYRITSKGRKEIRNTASKPGYVCIDLAEYKGRMRLHRIVYRKFVGPLDPHKAINHKDGNGLNNRVENLELVTIKENNKHAAEVLGHVRGKRILSRETAKEIRAQRRSGATLAQIHTSIKSKYGPISLRSIVMVVHGESWAKAV